MKIVNILGNRRWAFLAAFLALAVMLAIGQATGQISVSQTLSGPVVHLDRFAVGEQGNTIYGMRRGTTTFDSASVPATTKLCSSLPPITGTAEGDALFLVARPNWEDDIVLSEIQSGTIGSSHLFLVCLYNPTAAPINPAAVDLDYVVFDLTP